MVLSWQIVRFALKETFAIAYGNYSHREALLITLTKNGFSGYGECTAIDYYQIDLADYSQKLHSIKFVLENQTITHPANFYAFLVTLQLPSFLRSALDCGYWDLHGKLENKSFLSLNAIEINKIPDSSITISVAPIAIQLEKMEKSTWSKFKVKCDHFNENDILQLINTGKQVALDANGSFSKNQCEWLENLALSSSFTYIEQPMKPGIQNYSSLNNNKYPNWMADEDCQEQINLSLLQSHYRSINIKLVKCGGLTPAMELLKTAKLLGFKTMIGCMTESTIGISAGAVLAPLVDFVDLDGANLLQNDIAFGSSIVNGEVNLSDKPGLGIKLI